MDLLRPIIKPYAWGSRHALARLQGREEPSAGPEAELWMGAHPAGPAGLTRDGLTTTLERVVADAPERELGAACAGRFGGRLPFLLKVLAAEQPLSIQVHPDREQARAGFGARRSGGADQGPYADDWPKPELLYALTSFEVLAGFRSRDEAVAVLEGLGLARLRRVTHILRDDDGGGSGSGSDGAGAAALGDALRTVLEWPRDDRAALVHAVVEASRRQAALPGPHTAAYDAVARMAVHHPGDLGPVASLLLRHRVLEPGTALFVPAGGLHSYIRGVGVELMAASDNVLRAGLTTKEVDIPELLRITDPAVPVPVVRPDPVPGSERTRVYRCPVEEFALYRVRLGERPEPVTARGPRIALCAEGTALLRGPGGQEVPLGPGGSCFLPDSDRDVTAEGEGTLFVAATGLSPGHR
ncbi:mannose-6-phosphate isomerase, class I [Streptomyces sp. UH6]|uniref:mannose-6-phosphate isomerase, class I n=1 Tax=Streptomyces sp. UH6 TaxID=2748379 RepID=UPI0015D4992E|nr:mannose-6-phosphate isomerase, class I [Streptomyces sp. UH6]NYV74780.1 mannose-6-phosphate isomerase, class I [Streptomyces sp. UH6]